MRSETAWFWGAMTSSTAGGDFGSENVEEVGGWRESFCGCCAAEREVVVRRIVKRKRRRKEELGFREAIVGVLSGGERGEGF